MFKSLVGNHTTYTMPVDPDPLVYFKPGMYAQFKHVGDKTYATLSDGTAPIGIIDDKRDKDEDSTSYSGRIGINSSKSTPITTDQYEPCEFIVGQKVYVSENGKLTAVRRNSAIPSVGMCLIAPSDTKWEITILSEILSPGIEPMAEDTIPSLLSFKIYNYLLSLGNKSPTSEEAKAIADTITKQEAKDIVNNVKTVAQVLEKQKVHNERVSAEMQNYGKVYKEKIEHGQEQKALLLRKKIAHYFSLLKNVGPTKQDIDDIIATITKQDAEDIINNRSIVAQVLEKHKFLNDHVNKTIKDYTKANQDKLFHRVVYKNNIIYIPINETATFDLDHSSWLADPKNSERIVKITVETDKLASTLPELLTYGPYIAYLYPDERTNFSAGPYAWLEKHKIHTKATYSIVKYPKINLEKYNFLYRDYLINVNDEQRDEFEFDPLLWINTHKMTSRYEVKDAGKRFPEYLQKHGRFVYIWPDQIEEYNKNPDEWFNKYGKPKPTRAAARTIPSDVVKFIYAGYVLELDGAQRKEFESDDAFWLSDYKSLATPCYDGASKELPEYLSRAGRIAYLWPYEREEYRKDPQKWFDSYSAPRPTLPKSKEKPMTIKPTGIITLKFSNKIVDIPLSEMLAFQKDPIAWLNTGHGKDYSSVITESNADYAKTLPEFIAGIGSYAILYPEDADAYKKNSYAWYNENRVKNNISLNETLDKRKKLRPAEVPMTKSEKNIVLKYYNKIVHISQNQVSAFKNAPSNWVNNTGMYCCDTIVPGNASYADTLPEFIGNDTSYAILYPEDVATYHENKTKWFDENKVNIKVNLQETLDSRHSSEYGKPLKDNPCNEIISTTFENGTNFGYSDAELKKYGNSLTTFGQPVSMSLELPFDKVAKASSEVENSNERIELKFENKIVSIASKELTNFQTNPFDWINSIHGKYCCDIIKESNVAYASKLPRLISDLEFYAFLYPEDVVYYIKDKTKWFDEHKIPNTIRISANLVENRVPDTNGYDKSEYSKVAYEVKKMLNFKAPDLVYDFIIRKNAASIDITKSIYIDKLSYPVLSEKHDMMASIERKEKYIAENEKYINSLKNTIEKNNWFGYKQGVMSNIMDKYMRANTDESTCVWISEQIAKEDKQMDSFTAKELHDMYLDYNKDIVHKDAQMPGSSVEKNEAIKELEEDREELRTLVKRKEAKLFLMDKYMCSNTDEMTYNWFCDKLNEEFEKMANMTNEELDKLNQNSEVGVFDLDAMMRMPTKGVVNDEKHPYQVMFNSAQFIKNDKHSLNEIRENGFVLNEKGLEEINQIKLPGPTPKDTSSFLETALLVGGSLVASAFMGVGNKVVKAEKAPVYMGETCAG